MYLQSSFFIKALNKASQVVLVSLCFFALLGCEQSVKQRVYTLEGRTMGTTYHITAVVKPGVNIVENPLQIEVDKLLENINQVMSTYIVDSELSLLNRVEANKPTVVSEQLFSVLSLSRAVSDLSSGAFDITVGPLVNLWGFGPTEQKDQQPEPAKIEQTLAQVGYQHIALDKERLQVTKTANVYIDLSAVAKGYGADAVAELLEHHGISDYMVELGGEIALAGNNASGVGWRIGVEQPTLAQTGVIEAVTTVKGGIATSGDYRNYFEVEGRRFSHTIDPATGYPIAHTLASVTVVAASAAKADALATAINVLGPDRGYTLAVNKKIAAYFIIRHKDGFITKATPEFSQYRVTL